MNSGMLISTRLTQSNRSAIVLLFIAMSICVAGGASVFLRAGSPLAVFLFGYAPVGGWYPFTLQNGLLVIFAMGLGESLVQWGAIARQRYYLELGLLPEGDSTMLRSSDLPAINLAVRGHRQHGDALVLLMINRCINTFLGSKSIELTLSMLRAFSELHAMHIRSRARFLRLFPWSIAGLALFGALLCAIGAGHVEGAAPIEGAAAADLANNIVSALQAVAIAPVYCLVLWGLGCLLRVREERSLAEAMDYCLLNLIERLCVQERPIAGAQAAFRSNAT